MKNIASVLVIEKNKLASDRAWLIAIEIQVIDPATGLFVETMRLVRNDESVTINGNVFTPFPFSIDVQDQAGLPTVNLSIQDQTGTIQAKMQQYSGGVGFEVNMMIVSGDNNASIDSEPELTESFKIITASVDNYTVSWELGVGNPISVSFPRRRQYIDQCSFRYKSVECGYAGSIVSCDLTLSGLNGCKVHQNSTNFGGVPGVRVRG